MTTSRPRTSRRRCAPMRNGRVHFAFDAPSDLSAYRVMVVVAAKDDRVGSADARFARAPAAVGASARAALSLARRHARARRARARLDRRCRRRPTCEFQRAGPARWRRPRMQARRATPAGRSCARAREVQDVDASVVRDRGAQAGTRPIASKRDLHVRRPLDTELRVLALARAPQDRGAARLAGGHRSRAEPARDHGRSRRARAARAGAGRGRRTIRTAARSRPRRRWPALAAAPELARAILPELDTERALARAHRRRRRTLDASARARRRASGCIRA